MERTSRVVPGRDRSGSKKKEPAQADLKHEEQLIEENSQPDSVEMNTSEKDNDDKKAGEEKLFEAAKRDDAQAVDELLKKGIPADCRDKMERTPLMEGAYRGYAEVTKRLIERDADVNAVDDDGETAVFRATYGDHLELVKLLREHGADLEIRNKHGRTALDIAKDEGAPDIASFIE